MASQVVGQTGSEIIVVLIRRKLGGDGSSQLNKAGISHEQAHPQSLSKKSAQVGHHRRGLQRRAALPEEVVIICGGAALKVVEPCPAD